MARRDYMKLLEEHERHDVIMGRIAVEMWQLRPRMPPEERRRVERFIEEWLRGEHTLAEARRYLRELKRKYGGRRKRGR